MGSSAAETKKKITKGSVKKRNTEEQMVPIERMILFIREQRVILDSDLADLYGVTTRAFNQAVKRNADRFPGDFAFVLKSQELAVLRSQNVIAKMRRGGRRISPYVFTEHGAIMAANILRSKKAVHMSVYTVRAFVKLREMVSGNRKLVAKLAELEQRIDKQDRILVDIMQVMQKLVQPSPFKKKRRLGFYKN